MKGNVRPPALHPAITKRLDAVVPASVSIDCRWESVRRARVQAKAAQGEGAASPSAMMAWCVARTMAKHGAFRSLVMKDGTIVEQDDFELGIAVALEGDRLATAAIASAGRLGWPEVTAAYQRAVEETRAGKVTEVQAPINVTSLGGFGIEAAIPIVVPPAMGTLFIGTSHERMMNEGGVIHPVEVVTVTLTFDHKVVNGAGAAAFLHDLRREVEAFRLP